MSRALPAKPAHHENLRSNHLSFWEVAAQSIATIAPSAIPAMIVPLVFASAGQGAWVAFAFGTVVVILVAFSINVFTRRVASPGSIFHFVTLGLGPFWGAVVGWSLLIAYFFSAAAVLCGAVHYGEVFLAEVWTWQYTLPLTVGLIAGLGLFIWFFSYRDIRLSTRTLLVIEFAMVGLIFLLCIVSWWKSPVKIDLTQLSLHGVSGDQIRQGLIIAFFGFCGFESAATLGGEARNPLRSIPRAILFTVLFVGVFFTLSAYIVVLDLGGKGLAEASAPLSLIAASVGWPVLGTVIAAGVAVSFFACTIANVNAGARVAFSLARHRLLPARLGGVHRQHASPFVAVGSAIIFVVVLSVVFAVGGASPRELFDYFATVGAFGTLFSYLLVSISAPVFLFRRRELSISVVAVAVLAVGLLSVPVLGSLYPVPTWPANVLPYVFLILISFGVARLLFLKWREPATLSDISRDFNVAQGDIHETTREAPSELSEPLFQSK